MTETTNYDHLVISSDPDHPANLICSLCKHFYYNGWVTGTGGGLSIKQDNLIYLAPSGVQKERMVPENIFVKDFNDQTDYIRIPKGLKPSACTPLFLSSYNLRKAGACIHTHSQAAVMVSLLYSKEFRISNIEQVKALPKLDPETGAKIGSLHFHDELVIPIIENTPFEEDLTDSLQEAINKYPHTIAVLVRRHGIYVWGENVWKAKIYNEAIDYLLELAVKMNQFHIPTTCAIGEEKNYVQPNLHNH